jgi:hypothetical protein
VRLDWGFIAANPTHNPIIGFKPMPKATREASEPIKQADTGFAIADGTIEALKWLAVLLMVVDHVNKYLFDGKVGWMFAAGRIVMPVFAFVLAYNLARPNAFTDGRFKRTAKRLLIYGVIATVPYMALKGSSVYGWPLNIMFTLLVATLVLWLYEHRKPAQSIWLLPLFVFGSMLPEFWIAGTITVIAAYFYCKSPNRLHLLFWIASVTALTAININFYAMLAIPLILLAPKVSINIPRFKYFFYSFYPLHFALLWIYKVSMT